MNDNEAARVIGLLTAAWPDQELPDATLSLWIESLRDVDAAVGMESAATLTRTVEWFPRLARFLDEVGSVKRREQIRASQVRALPPIPPAARTLAKARVLALREATENIGKGPREQTHTHSVNGCPGCEALNRRVVEIQAELEGQGAA